MSSIFKVVLCSLCLLLGTQALENVQQSLLSQSEDSKESSAAIEVQLAVAELESLLEKASAAVRNLNSGIERHAKLIHSGSCQGVASRLPSNPQHLEPEGMTREKVSVLQDAGLVKEDQLETGAHTL